MYAEAIIENNEMRIINFPKNAFKGRHWKINIEPIEEIKDDFISTMTKTPIPVSKEITFFTRESANAR